MIALVLLCVGGGCAKSATVDDPEVKPLLAAMKVVDRTALGVSAIEGYAQMMLEGVPEPIPSDDGPPALLLFFMFIFACVLALAGGAIAALTLLVMAALLAGLIAAGVIFPDWRRAGIDPGFAGRVDIYSAGEVADGFSAAVGDRAAGGCRVWFARGVDV